MTHTLIKYGKPTTNGRTYNQDSFAKIPKSLTVYLNPNPALNNPSLDQIAGTAMITSDDKGIYAQVNLLPTPTGNLAKQLKDPVPTPVSTGRVSPEGVVYECRLTHISLSETNKPEDDLINTKASGEPPVETHEPE